MLKGFVSGEEKDIKRIPMKGKNLFDRDSISYPTGTTIKYFPIKVPDGTYTLSTNFPDFNTKDIFFLPGNASSGGSSSGSGVSLSTTRTRTAENGYVTVAMRYNEVRANPADYDIMLNAGSQALPYEPYGYQEGWEVRDNQDRIIWGREDELQTATGTLPFKGYGLPVKVKSLLGNAVQNGTPAPDNIVTPEMCGVRTAQLIPFPYKSTSGTITGVTVEVSTNGRIKAAGKTTGGYNWYLQNASMSLPAGTYTVSFVGKINGVNLRLRDVERAVQVAIVGGEVKSQTFTLSEDCSDFRIYLNTGQTGVDVNCDFVAMLNLGSTALPYEPYGWKVPFENHGENLFDVATAVFGKYIDSSGVEQISSVGENNHSDYIPVKSGMQYTLAETKPSYNGIVSAIAWYTSDKVFIQRDSATLSNLSGRVSNTWIAPSNAAYAIINFYRYPNFSGENDMLNEGSTPKPYSPYLNATIPVYLGEVPTVRKIRKLVFDGTEGWINNSNNACCALYISPIGFFMPTDSLIACTHMKKANKQEALYLRQVDYGISFGSTAADRICIRNKDCEPVADFKAWLASEYAAGHPVTVWYVTSEPETTISNEPLCKISTYADELTTIQVHGLSAPLYGIGDYKDTLNLSTGVVTRKVKKLVLTGEENFVKYSNVNNDWLYYYILGSANNAAVTMVVCTHAIYQSYTSQSSSPYARISDTKASLLLNLGTAIGNNNAESFKAYLAAQYQAGTPVTVWYVLDTPTTETVTVPTGMTGEIEGYLTQVSTPTPTNRSVPKWNGVEETGGTYAVTVYTPPEIPTTTGQNTLTVDSNLAPSKLEVSVHAKKIHYGFKIDKSNDDSESAVIYTHDAVTMTPAHMDFTNDRFDYGSWGNAFFVRDCYPVALNLDGTIAYRLDPDDYTKKMDGTPSDIFYELLTAAPSDWSTQWKQYYTKDANDNYELNSQGSAPTFAQDTYYKLTYNSSFTGNFMMAFPKVWFYRHEDSQYNYIEISNYKLSDDWKCYAHINASGQEVDFIYLPLFKGVIVNSKLRSLPGQIPQGNTTATDEVNAATALGSRWQIWDHSSVECLNDLLTLMSKSIDSQGRFGKGRESGYDSIDTVTYGKLQSGTLIKKGKFHGYSSGYKDVKVFGIESFWANRWDRLQGMLLVNNVWKIKMTPPYNFTGTDFVTLSNAEVPSGNGYLSKVQTSEYGSIPASIANGSSTKYFKDYFNKSTTDTRVALRGGLCLDGAYAGFRFVSMDCLVSYSGWTIGASPVYK